MRQSTSDPKLSAYDKQLLEDMRGSTPSGRLTTIDEGILERFNFFFLNSNFESFEIKKNDPS